MSRHFLRVASLNEKLKVSGLLTNSNFRHARFYNRLLGPPAKESVQITTLFDIVLPSNTVSIMPPPTIWQCWVLSVLVYGIVGLWVMETLGFVSVGLW